MSIRTCISRSLCPLPADASQPGHGNRGFPHRRSIRSPPPTTGPSARIVVGQGGYDPSRPDGGGPVATKLVGASVWEEELYEFLTSHEQSEREVLDEYQEAATSSGSSAFRYLSALIVEDEIRHHRVFVELASALKTDASSTNTRWWRISSSTMR